MYSQAGQPLWVRDERLGKRRQTIYLQGTLIAERLRPIGTDDETIKYQHADLLGTPVVVTNTSATPGVDNTFEYEPYGRLLFDTHDDTVGYTGHVMDKATGLLYMQQRYYDPAIGRFLSVDPVGPLSNPINHFGRYHYANNNPYKYTDPDGRFGVVGAAIGALIETGVQLSQNGGDFSKLDLTDIGVAAAVGAVTGGIGGRLATQAAKSAITASSAVRQTAAAGALASGNGESASALLNGEAPDPAKVATATVFGAAGAAGGAKIANSYAQSLDDISNSAAPYVAETSRSALVGRAAEATTTSAQQAATVAVDASAAAASAAVEKRLKR